MVVQELDRSDQLVGLIIGFNSKLQLQALLLLNFMHGATVDPVLMKKNNGLATR